ncbi:MAG: hypothetical protein ACJ8F7_09430 [Gemmataceae bacterium]
MTRIVIDAELRQKLRDFKEVLEFCDTEGKVLGQLIPWQESLYEPEPLSEEEVQRRLQEPSYTTAEVLAYLERL